MFTAMSAPMESFNLILEVVMVIIIEQFGGLVAELRNEIQSLRARIDEFE